MISAAGLDQIPVSELPEVAFAGRSNVGKSSLLNALVSRKMLAKTSNTPGRTQLLNFFSLGERLILADLPGYGYAEAPKANVERWTRLVRAYLRGRAPLRRALLLIDARHGIKDSDREVMAMLDEAAVSFQAVLTKSDKVRPGPLEERLAASADELARHTAAYPEVLATSARTASGIPELRAALAALAARSPSLRGA
jgi:GTP-binding protein